MIEYINSPKGGAVVENQGLDTSSVDLVNFSHLSIPSLAELSGMCVDGR